MPPVRTRSAASRELAAAAYSSHQRTDGRCTTPWPQRDCPEQWGRVVQHYAPLAAPVHVVSGAQSTAGVRLPPGYALHGDVRTLKPYLSPQNHSNCRSTYTERACPSTGRLPAPRCGVSAGRDRPPTPAATPHQPVVYLTPSNRCQL